MIARAAASAALLRLGTKAPEWAPEAREPHRGQGAEGLAREAPQIPQRISDAMSLLSLPLLRPLLTRARNALSSDRGSRIQPRGGKLPQGGPSLAGRQPTARVAPCRSRRIPRGRRERHPARVAAAPARGWLAEARVAGAS